MQTREQKKESSSLKVKEFVEYDSDKQGEENSDSNGDEMKEVMNHMIMLANSFPKKFFKKPGSGNQRYSSKSRRFETRERHEPEELRDLIKKHQNIRANLKRRKLMIGMRIDLEKEVKKVII